MKGVIMKSTLFIFFVAAIATSCATTSHSSKREPANAGSAQIECSQGIVKSTTISGATQITLRDYTLNELCSDDTVKECRQELKEELQNDPETQKKIAEQLEKSGNSSLAKSILKQSVNAIVDTLLSSKTISMKVNDHQTLKLGPTSFVEYKPMNRLHGSEVTKDTLDRSKYESYEVYPNLEREFGARKAKRFRTSLGGKITKDLSQILSFEQVGNFSTAYYDEWYTGEINGPEIHNAIVGNQLVITLQKKMGKVEKVMAYPIPLGQKLEIPFSTNKQVRGLNVNVDSVFTIECRNK
jgi:hypothetical protein